MTTDASVSIRRSDGRGHYQGAGSGEIVADVMNEAALA
jgi:hypothetical protein